MSHPAALPCRLLTALGWALALAAPAPAQVQFGPPRLKPGESIRMVAHTESKDGTVERSTGGKSTIGTMRAVRDREIVWTLRDPDPAGQLRVMARIQRYRTVSLIKLGEEEDMRSEDSRLTGKLIAATRDKEGEWKFELDGTPLGQRDRAELEELGAYQKRKWFPDRAVKVGDSWEFDPAWIKLVIERDLSKAQTIGTMKLTQVRRSWGKETALIDVSVRSTGNEWRADGRETTGSLALNGRMTVNLGTMLDEQLLLDGTLESTARKGIESTKLKLPLRMEVKKSVVKGGLAP